MRKWNKLLALLLAMVMAFSTMSTALADGEEAAADAEAPAAETEAPVAETEAPAEDAEAGAYNGTIVILHTNDVHGAIAGYAKVAALAAKYEAEGAYVLIMDAGDFSQGEAEVSVSEGATAVEMMDMAGYDVVTLGNHEFDYGYTNLLENFKEADFQVTAANVTYEGVAAFENYVVFEAPGGTKVGVFGLSTPETATKAHPAKIKGVTFAAGEDMYAIAQTQVDALTAAGCDVIVTLAHLGIDEGSAGNRSTDLLEHVTGIDVLIDGHSHSTEEDVAAATNADRKVGETVVTSTGTKLENIGVITIKDGAITTNTVASESITVAEDDAIVARAAEIAAEIEADYGTVFAKTEVKLSGDRAPGVRTQETPLGNLIADAILWYATKDGELPVPAENVIALTNGGGIRATIEAGDITKKDVNTVLPFGNTVAYITITGAALLEALEASTYAAPDALGGFPQVSGINFTVNTMKKFDAGDLYEGSTYSKPNSINRVTIDSVNGKAFDPAATYAIVTNDFTAAGGDTYYAFSVATVVDTGAPLDEVVMAYITEVLGGVVTAEKYGETAGRITIKGYSDVSGQNWFYDAAVYATEKGLIDGLTETTFGPSENMTRAGLVTALYRLAGSPEVTAENPFSDVADDAAYKNAVIWANENGVVTGKTETTFDPNGSILRQEIAALLYRYVSGQGYDVSIGEKTNILSYTDAQTISEYAIPAIQWMCGVGLFQGNADGSIQPKATATRAQVATILMRFDALKLTPVEETPAEPAAAYIETEITFEVAEQEGVPAHTVTGILTVPTAATKAAPVPGVVMLHGTGSNLHEVLGAYDTAAQEMAKKGIATLRFNFQGIGDGKEAEYVNYSYTSANIDAKAAADYLAKLETVDGEKLGVMGWSQGGTNALLAAAAYPETFKAVVTWAGALDLTGLFADFDAAAAEAAEKGFVNLVQDWRTDLPHGAKWFEDVKNTDVLAKAKTITAPILTINGEKDDVVDPASGAEIVKDAANSLSKNVIIPNCDHTMNMFVEGATEINTVIANTADFFVQAFAAMEEATVEAAA